MNLRGYDAHSFVIYTVNDWQLAGCLIRKPTDH